MKDLIKSMVSLKLAFMIIPLTFYSCGIVFSGEVKKMDDIEIFRNELSQKMIITDQILKEVSIDIIPKTEIDVLNLMYTAYKQYDFSGYVSLYPALEQERIKKEYKIPFEKTCKISPNVTSVAKINYRNYVIHLLYFSFQLNEAPMNIIVPATLKYNDENGIWYLCDDLADDPIMDALLEFDGLEEDTEDSHVII